MLILGLGVAADQILVQPHEQGQGVVDRAEGYGSDGGAVGVRLKMFLLELQSQKEMTPLSQLVPRKEGYKVMRMVMTPDDASTNYLRQCCT